MKEGFFNLKDKVYNQIPFLRNLVDKYFSINTCYVAAVVYLWLSMFYVPMTVRFIIVLCVFFPKRFIRILGTLLAFGLCFFLVKHDSSEMLLYGLGIIPSIFIMEYKKSRKKSYCNSLILLLFSMAALMILDASQGMWWKGFLRTYTNLGVFPSCLYRGFSIFLIITIIRIIDCLINRLKISSLVGFNFLFLLGAINYWTLAITNKEFALTDLQLTTTVAGVISNVQVQTSDIIVFLIYVGTVIVFNICICKIRWEKESRKDLLKHAVFALIYFMLMVYVIQGGIFKIYTYKAVEQMGLASNLVATAKGIEKPSGLDVFMNVIEKEKMTAEKMVTEEVERPNIIVIMSEAFSDLQRVANFDTNEDYMPYIRSVLEKYPSGTLYSSVYGNNTASSEYEFLTGVSTGLTVSGGTIYQSHMEDKEDSIVSLLKEQGYYTTGIHSYDGVGYNRTHAWESFGFDKIMFQDDFDDNVGRVRNYISDASFYDKIISEYEQNKDKGPIFTFGLSMQNHATYRTDYEGDIKLTDMKYDDVEEYLSLIKETDSATKDFLSYFENIKENTLIVFFGDHQPMVSSEFYSEIIETDFYELDGEEKSLIYQIPYFVWTNYEDEITVPKKASINYLSNITLNAAGLPKNNWFYFLDEVFEEFPVVTENFVYAGEKFFDGEKVDEALKILKVPDNENMWNLLKEYQAWSYVQAISDNE